LQAIDTVVATPPCRSKEKTMHRKFLAIPLAIAVSACAQVPNLTSTVQVPDRIKGSANESLAMIVAAKGAQIYECRAS
jgi:hypothetical protein